MLKCWNIGEFVNTLYAKGTSDNILHSKIYIKVLGEWLEGMDRELVCVLNLQADLKPINMNIVSMGALNEAQVHPREVMKSAILSNAACMMLLHNHRGKGMLTS